MIPYGLQTKPSGPTDVAADILCVCPTAFRLSQSGFGFADTLIIIIIIIISTFINVMQYIEILGFTPSVWGLGCPKMFPRFMVNLGILQCADHAYELRSISCRRAHFAHQIQ